MFYFFRWVFIERYSAEEAKNYFDLSVSSPFMLYVVPVLEKVKRKIPAVVHVDGTARPQTVTKNQNPLFLSLIHI